MSEFRAFPPETLKFFNDIKKNNKRAWFEKNKTRYEKSVVEPVKYFVNKLNQEKTLKKLGIKNTEKTPLFRIYRDIRFSSDKSPFKTYNGIVFSLSGSRKENAVLYIHLQPNASFVASGIWQPDTKLLNQIRNWVMKNSTQAKNLLKQLDKNKIKFSDQDVLKRPPRGFEHVTDEKLMALLKLKSWVVSEKLENADIQSPRGLKKITAFAERSAPLLKALWPIYKKWQIEEELNQEITSF